MGYPYLMVPVTEILHHQYKAMVARQQTTGATSTACRGVSNTYPTVAAVNLKRLSRATNIHPDLLRPYNYLNMRRTRGYALADLDTMILSCQNDVAAAKTAATINSVDLDDMRGYLHDILENMDAGRHSLGPYIYGPVGAAERYWATWKTMRIRGEYWDGSQWVGINTGQPGSLVLRNPNRADGKFCWPHIILHADWQETVSGIWCSLPANPPARMDLGATRLNCRGFCHFGCSTFVHNYPVMRGRRMKNWRRSRDGHNRLCFWTTKPAPMDIAPYWLYHMLTYVPGSRVRGRTYRTRKWGDVCNYARACTNIDLGEDNRQYTIK